MIWFNLKKWRRLDKIQAKKQQWIINVNSVLTTIFAEKTTKESIELFTEIQDKFKEELQKRLEKAKQEQKNIEEFFNENG